jgi:tetratricopeptide (TPR) repeat protein
MELFAKGIAIVVFAFAGYLIVTFLRRLNIVIKHPIITSLVLWGIGFPLVLSNIDKADSSPINDFLAIVGVIILFIAAAIGFFYILNPSAFPRPTNLGETKATSYVTKLTEKILNYLFSSSKINIKKCPFCAEKIKVDAVKCRYCGEWIKDKTSIDENLPKVSIESETHNKIQMAVETQKSKITTAVILSKFQSAKRIFSTVFSAVAVTAAISAAIFLAYHWYSSTMATRSFQEGEKYRLENKYREAIDHYSRALDYDSTYAQAYLARGISYQNVDEPQKAINDYNQAIKYDDQFVNKKKSAPERLAEERKRNEIRCNIYLNRAQAWMELNDYRQALSDCDRAMFNSSNPLQLLFNRDNAYICRARCYRELGKPEEAIDNLTEAINISSDPSLYTLRGDTYIRYLNDNANAIRDFRTAAKLGDKDAQHMLEEAGIKW